MRFKKMWDKCENFTGLKELMALFLLGKIKKNPWYNGELNPETIPLLKDLVQINKKGLVSLNGQPGVYETEKLSNGKILYKYQRAYIQGFMKRKHFEKFAKKLLAKEKYIIAFAKDEKAYQYLGDIDSVFEKYKDDDTETLYLTYQFTLGDYFSLDTFFPKDMIPEDYEAIRYNGQLHNELVESTYIVYITEKEPGNNNLLRDILECL